MLVGFAYMSPGNKLYRVIGKNYFINEKFHIEKKVNETIFMKLSSSPN